MQDYLKKAMSLSKKTGDRLIIYDSNNPDNSFVFLTLNDYEKLIISKSEVRGLTEEELLDKINRDIAIWKSSNFESDFDCNNFENKTNFFVKPKDNNVEDSFENEEDMYYYSENDEEKIAYNEALEMNEDKKKSEPKNFWKIPQGIKESAEEIINK